jgi:GrpB-like predicted nucleotidyltransferase (UPF0157 family)
VIEIQMNVTLVEKYNAEWPRWLEEIKTYLGEKVVNACLTIEHVGSTSIPGMTAKPIIDLNLVIERENFGEIKRLLEERGYCDRGDLGIKDRESFGLPDETLEKTLPAHHLYVTPKDSEELKRHITFREYLKTHRADRDRLSKLKWALAEAFNNDKYPYMDGKDTLVKEITEKALEWYGKKRLTNPG